MCGTLTVPAGSERSRGSVVLIGAGIVRAAPTSTGRSEAPSLSDFFASVSPIRFTSRSECFRLMVSVEVTDMDTGWGFIAVEAQVRMRAGCPHREKRDSEQANLRGRNPSETEHEREYDAEPAVRQ
jgi:hypothetical protein